jgi:hypothetical protein
MQSNRFLESTLLAISTGQSVESPRNLRIIRLKNCTESPKGSKVHSFCFFEIAHMPVYASEFVDCPDSLQVVGVKVRLLYRKRLLLSADRQLDFLLLVIDDSQTVHEPYS